MFNNKYISCKHGHTQENLEPPPQIAQATTLNPISSQRLKKKKKRCQAGRPVMGGP